MKHTSPTAAQTGAAGHPARWWHLLDDGRIQCDLCPRDCRLHEGQRGACFVRQRSGDAMVLTTYGRSSGFCIDPVEKKPLNHFYPGSSILSFGTAGCNLACKFCQNWDISKSRDMDRLMDEASPEAIAQAAENAGAKSVAFTYNDPVIFAEYAMDVADACHARGIKTVAVTAGYIHDAPRREYFAKMDAANVDLKAFTDEFYVKQCGAHLQPVLDDYHNIPMREKLQRAARKAASRGSLNDLVRILDNKKNRSWDAKGFALARRRHKQLDQELYRIKTDTAAIRRQATKWVSNLRPISPA